MTPTTAFVFPGGGSQVSDPVGPFHEAWPEVERAIERLDSEAVRSLLFEASEQRLNELLNMHLVVVASGYVVADAVIERFGVEPDFVAGHSVGHFTALPVAGALAPDVALSFVSERSESMLESATGRGPGKMVAVLLVDSATIEDVVRDLDGVAVAAYNSPKQTVISGRTDAVDEACERLQDDHGPVRTVELDVEIAAHSPLVEDAEEQVEAALEDLALSDPDIPVVSDRTGEPYETAAVARRDLSNQITSPVQWQSIVETFVERGVERVVEFPPAGVLTDFVSRTAPELETIPLEEPDDARGVFGDT